MVGVDLHDLGRCQKSGCRTFGAAREAPSSRRRTTKRVGVLMVEWIVLFSLVRALLYLRLRLRGTAMEMAYSFDDACTTLLHQVSALRDLRFFRARRRPVAALGSSASLGSLVELIGSDQELELESLESRSLSFTTNSTFSNSTYTSYYTKCDSEATSDNASVYTGTDSEATTVAGTANRAALRKRVPKDSNCSNPPLSSSSSTCVLTSHEEPTTSVAHVAAKASSPLEGAHYDSPYYESDSSSTYNTSDSSGGNYVSSASILSKIMKYLTKQFANEIVTGTALKGKRERSCSPLRDKHFARAHDRPPRHSSHNERRHRHKMDFLWRHQDVGT